MINVAIVTGGYDSERVVSLQSAKIVKQSIDLKKYNPITIDITKENWTVLEHNVEIDKNDFSFTIENKKTKIQKVFMCIHGSPAEDGLLQGYFEMLNIPYTGCNTKTSAITMDKDWSKKMVSKHCSVFISKSLVYSSIDDLNIEDIKTLGFPLFIKPNSAGSSFGVSKVNKLEDIHQAAKIAFEHSEKILIEEFINGRELAQGVYQNKDKLIILPITEIISDNDFFDYEAKYLGKSQEITPANNISKEKELEISNYTKVIFELFQCKDISRIDYFLKNDDIYFLEINTLPGLTTSSIFPQQARALGIKFEDIVNSFLENI